MKPSFALNLSHDGIGLLQRRETGWQKLGDVSLEAEDLADALAGLRKAAEAEAGPDGLMTKLIIPASQILYTEVHAPGPSPAARRRQIAEALEGLTPYDVPDLVFDWTGPDETVQVAVVARETLDEAEAFAQSHGFAPIAFAAIPESGAFAAEPWFGLSSVAASYLPEGARVERDADPIRLLEEAPVLEVVIDAPPAPSELAEIEHADVDAQVELASEPAETVDFEHTPAAAEDAPDEAAAEDESVEDPLPTETKPETESEATVVDKGPEAPLPEDSPALSDIAPDPAPDVAATEAPQAFTHETSGPSVQADLPDDVQEIDVSEGAGETAVETEYTPEEARPDQDQPSDTKELSPEPVETLSFPELEEDLPPPLDDVAEDPPASALTPAAFTSRRITTPDTPESPAAPEAKSTAPKLAAPPKRLETLPPRKSALEKGTLGADVFGVTAPGLAVPKFDAEAALEKGGKAAKALGKAARKSLKTAAKGTAALGQNTRKAMAKTTGEAPSPTGESQAPATTSQPAPNKTVFGGRKTEVGGKPRYLGYVLTVGLVLFMAIVALWSSFLGEPDTIAETPAQQTETAALAPAIAAPEPPTPEVTETAAQPEPEPAITSDIAQTTPDEAREPETVPEASEPPAEPVMASEVTEPLPETPDESQPPEGEPDDYSTTRVFPPSALPPLPEVNLNLAALSSATQPPTAPTTPEPAAVEPTPEGVLMPGAFTLFAGQPPLVPPARPATIADLAATALAEAEKPYADPALAGIQPKARPEAVSRAAAEAAQSTAETAIPETADPATEAPAAEPPQTEDEAALSPEEQAEIARLGARTPLPRPATIATASREAQARQQAEAEAQAKAEADALAAAAAAAEAAVAALAAEATADPFASATRQAVTVSRRPADKPRNFSRIVTAALAAPKAPAPPAASATPTAPQRGGVEPTSFSAPAPPDELDEPEPTGPAPKVPTSASVAKQATVKNGIQLGEMNLIGLYGSSNSRRALIRMANGKFVKVGVGDRLDGGKVTAIGDGQLTYQKGSRSYTLKLLKGS